MNRRDFLKKTGLLAAALAIVPTTLIAKSKWGELDYIPLEKYLMSVWDVFDKFGYTYSKDILKYSVIGFDTWEIHHPSLKEPALLYKYKYSGIDRRLAPKTDYGIIWPWSRKDVEIRPNGYKDTMYRTLCHDFNTPGQLWSILENLDKDHKNYPLPSSEVPGIQWVETEIYRG